MKINILISDFRQHRISANSHFDNSRDGRLSQEKEQIQPLHPALRVQVQRHQPGRCHGKRARGHGRAPEHSPTRQRRQTEKRETAKLAMRRLPEPLHEEGPPAEARVSRARKSPTVRLYTVRPKVFSKAPPSSSHPRPTRRRQNGVESVRLPAVPKTIHPFRPSGTSHRVGPREAEVIRMHGMSDTVRTQAPSVETYLGRSCQGQVLLNCKIKRVYYLPMCCLKNNNSSSNNKIHFTSTLLKATFISQNL